MIKKIFDFIVALLALFILLPFFLVVAVLIKADSKGAVFFRQTRVGKGGKLFKIYKFRTMEQVQPEGGLKITVGGDSRITKIGRALRKSKLDELPQLINIIKGEMSFVGPRPEVPEYVEHYSQQDKDIVLSVRPGITDLASIEFRDENDILAGEDEPEKAYIEKILPEKLKYCRFYVDNQSFFGDIAIILRTIKAVF